MKYFMILIMVALIPPAFAKDAGDIQADLDKQFPGKVVGVSFNDGEQPRVNQFAANIKQSEIDAINAYLSVYDISGTGQREINAEIDQKIKAAASDKSMTDDEFARYRAALVRAKDIDNLEDKQNKVNDAEVLKPQARRTRNDIRRLIQTSRQQTESGRRQLSQSQVRRIKNPRS